MKFSITRNFSIALLTTLAVAILSFGNARAQVGIGTTSPKAMLDIHMDQPVVNEVTGFLVPRVSTMYAGADTNGDGIVDDIEPGLMVFYTGSQAGMQNTFYVYHQVHGWQTIMEAGSDPCPTAAIDNVSETQELSCSVPEIFLVASGEGTYAWNTGATSAGITVSTPGTYTVTVTAANGCSAVSSDIVITQSVLGFGAYDCANKGVVVWVNSNNPNNYKIISMRHLDEGGDDWDEFKLDWGDKGTSIGANDNNNGFANTQVWISAYTDNGTGSSKDAPYRAYHHDPNNTGGYDNWYLPAKDELTALFNSNLSVINNSLQINGGQQILNNQEYWSSTEVSSNRAYRIKIDNDGEVSDDDQDKDDSEYVRAFKEIGG